MKLSILIPTIKIHDRLFTKLKFDLYGQMLPYQGEIELITDDHETYSIGAKRNRLLSAALGKYVAFFDADDRPSPDYIKLIMEGIDKDVDCCSLKGLYSENGKKDGIFEHSIRYKEWKTTTNLIRYERFPNHLNVIRASIAKQFKFPDTSWSEDKDWSTQIFQSGLIKTEHYIDEIIYYYNHISNKAEYEKV